MEKNIIKIAKDIYLIDNILLKIIYSSNAIDIECYYCYFKGMNCLLNKYSFTVCEELSEDHRFHSLTEITNSLVLNSKIRHEYNKNKQKFIYN